MPHAHKPSLILTPIRQAAPAVGGTLDVLIRVQAPPQPSGASAPARPPLRLAIVVDRSGSMSGEPLKEALRCTEYIAGALLQGDRLAVVLYDNQVQVPVPLAPAGNAAVVRKALAGVESGGNTALFAGWETGARCLEGGDARSLSRVMLLSDGQANEGLCDPREIEQHCARWASAGVTTTTVGLGRNFNEDLMIGMGRAGQGQHYYGQTAEDLHDSFDEELALLLALFLRQLRVKLVGGNGVVVEPLGLVQRSADGSFQLPDLAWDAEAWMLVRLHLAPAEADASPAQKQALLAVTLQAHAADGGDAVTLNAVLTLPRLSEADLRGLPADETVARRLKEVEFASGAMEVQALLRSGGTNAAKLKLADLEVRVGEQPWLAEKIAIIRELIEADAEMSAKEIAYSSRRAASRLASVAEPQYSASETQSDDIPMFLRRKASQGQGRKPKP